MFLSLQLTVCLVLGATCRAIAITEGPLHNNAVINLNNTAQGKNFQRLYNENVGEFGVVYKKEISKGTQFSWKFIYGDDGTNEIEPVVHTWVDSSVRLSIPVVFEVRHHQSHSWSLPVSIGNNRVFYNINKTLCTPPENRALEEVEESIEVIVSTKSDQVVTFTLEVNLKNIKIDRLDKNFTVSLSPTSPTYFKLGPVVQDDDDDVDSLYARLEVNLIRRPAQQNEYGTCFTVSLQKPSCPLQDHPGILRANGDGVLHTMSTTTTITIHVISHSFYPMFQRNDLKEERFLIFIMHHDYSYCDSSQNTWKDQLLQMNSINQALSDQQLEFVVRKSIPASTYYSATLGVAAFLFAFSICFAIIHLKCRQNVATDIREYYVHHESSMESSTYNLCCLLFQVKDHTSRTNVNLKDSCTKSSEQISKSAHRYFGTFWVVSLFYAIPVVQFILLYQRVLNKTGNQDSCYFNFKCLHPLGFLTAFNHSFSNIAYVMLGLLFLFIVFVVSRSRYRKRCELENKGIFEHNGIYFAMGSALVMEGLMSSFYHVCPTHLNFQFDTSFMYITAMLCMVKIYQSRHPDSNASAIMAFFGMALVIFLVIITSIYQTWWLWMVITFLHVAASLMFSLHLYSWGDWRLWRFWNTDLGDSTGNLPTFEKCRLLLKSCLFPFRPLLEPITGFLVALNILNWGFVVVGHVIFYDSQDIASYLLMLFLLNLTIYTAIYVVFKLAVAKERILRPSWIYFAISVIFWISGLIQFFKLSASWGKSQAESRELNKECSFLGFYDEHDVWHFLSAFGMFFMFMFFYTMDDGLVEIERDMIKVV